MPENTDKGFTVKDKRAFTENGSKRESEKPGQHTGEYTQCQTTTRQTSQDTQREKSSTKQSKPLPEINFSSFILSLSSSALLHFGEIPDPITNKKQRNILMAKQTIDILGILKDKTSGNLTKEEESLLNNLLYDLRMRYVKESEKESTE